MQDSFGRNINYLRLSVTEQCDLHCRYCMPAGSECAGSAALLSEDEMVNAVKAAAELGVNKVRITGGEPLLHKNILSICERIASVEGIDELCLTTNGTLLSELAVPLRQAGVKRLNISLDTLDEEKFRYITRGGELSDVLAGIGCAVNAGFDRVKLNTVLIGGFNDDEIPTLAQLTLRLPLDVRFIELMPMKGSEFTAENYIPASVVLEKVQGLHKVRLDEGISRLYVLAMAIGYVGLITPVSQPFCKDCSRIRLTADGKIKPCLHSDAEYSIKGLSIEDMKAQFERAISLKPEQHNGLCSGKLSEAGRDMNRIGG